MKKSLLMIVLLAVFIAALPNHGKCSGIPVFDASSMINQLRDLLQQIMIYEEAISQNTQLTQQYYQMLRDYQLKLTRFRHYLNQLQSVRHMISQKDWLRILQTIKYYYGKSKRAVIVQADPENPSYEEDMNTVLRQYGHVPRDPAAVEADARQLGIWTDQYGRQVRSDWEAYELMKDRLRMVSNNDKESRHRRERILPGHANLLDNLGDDSDLATLQAIAAQNQTMMNQMEALIQIQNQILLNMESEKARRAAQSAEWREKEMERLRNRKPTPLLGRDRWGHF